jgi:hypothetical protein
MDSECNNQGRCRDFQCKCEGPWQGPYCTTPQNCYQQPCQSGGVCELTGHCTCPQGYYGNYCEQSCLNGGCFNGGTCDEHSGMCSCPVDYFPPLCLQALPCNATRPCVRGHSNCTASGQCLCDIGQSGVLCERDAIANQSAPLGIVIGLLTALLPENPASIVMGPFGRTLDHGFVRLLPPQEPLDVPASSEFVPFGASWSFTLQREEPLGVPRAGALAPGEWHTVQICGEIPVPNPSDEDLTNPVIRLYFRTGAGTYVDVQTQCAELNAPFGITPPTMHIGEGCVLFPVCHFSTFYLGTLRSVLRVPDAHSAMLFGRRHDAALYSSSADDSGDESVLNVDARLHVRETLHLDEALWVAGLEGRDPVDLLAYIQKLQQRVDLLNATLHAEQGGA